MKHDVKKPLKRFLNEMKKRSNATWGFILYWHSGYRIA